jgi:hypothetical protein
MRIHGILVASLITALAAAGAGCQRGPVRPATAPVVGRVTTKGGKPCDGALVVLHSKAPERSGEAQPVGKTSDDGSFSLTTYEASDGAVPGSYGATIVWPAKVKEARMSLSSEGGAAAATNSPAATAIRTIPASRLRCRRTVCLTFRSKWNDSRRGESLAIMKAPSLEGT